MASSIFCACVLANPRYQHLPLWNQRLMLPKVRSILFRYWLICRLNSLSLSLSGFPFVAFLIIPSLSLWPVRCSLLALEVHPLSANTITPFWRAPFSMRVGNSVVSETLADVVVRVCTSPSPSVKTCFLYPYLNFLHFTTHRASVSTLGFALPTFTW